MSFSRILLCVDGESHTDRAVSLALDLAKVHAARLDALYVVDPFLKKFTNEIYAVGRDECRDHLDRCLEADGEAALERFRELAGDFVVGCRIVHGEPEQVIPELVATGRYDVVVLGGKRFESRYARWTSRDLPGRLDGKLDVPVLLARV